MTGLLERTITAIGPVDRDAASYARDRWMTRAKPPGSLGRLEDLAVRVAGIVGKPIPPAIEHPAIVVFAGDHGVVADGASAWPQEVTALMVANMVSDGAAINAFASTVGATVRVVDVGVATDLSTIAGVVDAKVRAGTASLASGSAMTATEARAALEVGIAAVDDLVAQGADLVVGGEMGIGNTTPASALIASFTGATAATVTGAGAGLPADRIDHKQGLIAAALDRSAEIDDPLSVIAEVGGLEIAALAGLYLGAAAAGVPVIVDGVIALAGLCCAEALAPGTAERTIAGHRSPEPAVAVALDYLGLEPLLDLGLRLGEGTGAALAIPLVQASVNALRNMADLPG